MFSSLRKKFEFKKNDFVLVSMYGGDAYYYQAAAKLREQCKELNIECDLIEIDTVDRDWIDICRKKISIYRELLIKHKKAIFWVDVDTELLKKPRMPVTDFDIGLFMRGFKDLSKYDPITHSRKFEPGYIMLSYNNNTMAFLDFLYNIEKEGKDIKATDDYFLQEAFDQFEGSLRYLIFSRDEISRRRSNITNKTYMLHGDSGNVKVNKGVAKQHEKYEISNSIKKHVFIEQAISWAKKGNRKKAIEFYEIAFKYDPNDLLIAEKLYVLYGKENDHDNRRRIKTLALNNDDLRLGFLKILLVERLEANEFKEAEYVSNMIYDANDQNAIAFCQSKMYRYGFNRKALEANVDDSRRVNMFWWEHPYPGNLGDVLSPYIVEKLTNIPPKFVARDRGLLSVGSIIKWASDESIIWGSGTSTQNISLPSKAKYNAVRGPYTRDEIIKSGGICPKVYGDPAWLLPAIYKKNVVKKHKLGVILHYTHEDTGVVFSNDIKLISIRRVGYQQIEEFLDELLACEKIVSSSLHGVIIANAYKIPVVWADVTDAQSNIHGDGIKFKDYFATIGINEDLEPINLSSFKSVDLSSFKENDFWLPKKDIDCRSLLESAPFYSDVDSHIKEHYGISETAKISLA